MFDRPAAFQARLLNWYRSHARKLPWRETKDPYKIWVSEIMLQQTQVETVIPYYQRWIRRFSTLKSLAKTPLNEVMKYWAGLGYYRRVRMLHEAAKKIVKTSGEMPRTRDELLKLPGIGRYTAGAIASIAFDEKTAALDGNVIRVLTRMLALKDDILNPKTVQKLWTIAENLVPKKSPGDFNQAIMELGATICVPQNPRCLICPVTEFCEARKLNTAEKFPVRKQKEKILKRNAFALILHQKGKVLIRKQPLADRWGGLWMFPFWNSRQSMTQELGVSAEKLKRRLTVHHGFTKYRVKLEVFEHKLHPHPNLLPQRGRRDRFSISPLSFGERARVRGKTQWVPIPHLSKFAFPSPHQKIAKELMTNA